MTQIRKVSVIFALRNITPQTQVFAQFMVYYIIFTRFIQFRLKSVTIIKLKQLFKIY